MQHQDRKGGKEETKETRQKGTSEVTHSSPHVWGNKMYRYIHTNRGKLLLKKLINSNVIRRYIY